MKDEDWINSDWFKVWGELATKPYHFGKVKVWYCFVDKDGKISYKYMKQVIKYDERKH